MDSPAFQHPLLSPRRDDSLLADPVDRVHAWHLSSEIPLFRRETNEKLPPPSSPFPANFVFTADSVSLSLSLLPSVGEAVTLYDRAHSTLPFSSRQPSRSPSRPHVLMCDLIRSFFRPTRRLLNCLARCVSLHPVNSAPGKIPLRYTLLRTARKCIRFVTR